MANIKWTLVALVGVLTLYGILFGCLAGMYVAVENMEKLYGTDEPEPGTKGPSATGPVAIRLSGVQRMLSLRKTPGEDGSDLVNIDVWEDGAALANAEHFRLLDRSRIEVLRSGSYLVYAQLSLRKKGGMASFSILKSGPEAKDVALSEFIIAFPTPEYATLETGYTAVLADLREGDTVSLAVLRDDFSIDFQRGKSFLGITGLRE